MLFWSMTIGFVVWVIAVAVEVIWFWGPGEEEESDSGLVQSAVESSTSASPPEKELMYDGSTGLSAEVKRASG